MLRTVAGLTKSTPKEVVHLETEVVPLRVEGQRRAMIAYERSLRLGENNTRRGACEGRFGRRLKANKGL